MRVEVLGSAVATLDGAPVDLGTLKQRAVLAALALTPRRAVPTDTLVDLVWGDAAPPSGAATLQAYVARLRRALEPRRAARGGAQVLVTREGGYALLVEDDALDARRFEAAVQAAHATVGAPTDPGGAAVEELADALDGALSLWRGTPYPELGDAPAAVAERARLDALRMLALEDRAVAALRLGRHAVVSAELEQLTGQYPLRERLWALRALALTRSGRQAEALDVLTRVRRLLADELGLEPGAELRDLQGAVLRQDPGLAWTPPTTERGPRARHDLPLVGRDEELSALVGLLDRPGSAFAVVTGEPGIGKTRLCSELVERAGAEGATVLLGRCSQDEGAPPLYPCASILRPLGAKLPRDEEAAGDDATAFRARETIVRAVLAAAGERPLVVVLDDLHWADTSTLRVLRLLAEVADTERLLVVATWRDDPHPSGHLAAVADVLARRHALRIGLGGLSTAQAATVLAAVTDHDPSPDEARALRERTEGNPFFLVEYARLAHEPGELTALLAEPTPPAAVHDVLARRLAGVGAEAVAVLARASVLGRTFDASTLAAVADLDEEVVLDHLHAALAGGLVRELDVGEFGFHHALVRDTAYASQSRTRRARTHADAARALASTPGRESEVARHWLAAGRAHAGDAWRAGMAAAAAASEVFALDEAVELLRAATATIGDDPSATPEDELALLGVFGEALQRTGNWVDLRPVVHRSLEVARARGDLDAVVRAATTAMTNAIWQSGSHSAQDPVVVGALREALEALPPGDGAPRCRVMLSLAGEIYYGSSPREREALADEGLAMARRLGDPSLLQWALLSTFTSIWRPHNVERRVALATEAADLARAARDETGLSAALTLRTVASGELAWDEGMDARLAAARAQAESCGHLYAELVLHAFEVPWAAMRGERERVEELLADMLRLLGRTSLIQAGDAIAGAWAMRNLWMGTSDELAETVQSIADQSTLPVEPVVAGLWCRAGQPERAERYLETHHVDLGADDWFSPMAWATAAELAVHLGPTELAATAYSRLVTIRGRPASAGSGTAVGPADAFMAMAAHAVGERDLATRHADDAARLCEEWRIPLAASWWARERVRLGI